MPQQFRSKPRSAAKTIAPRRESRTKRGYTAEWDRLSTAYRKKNPFCKFCLEQGRMTLVVLGNTGVVDHKWPIEDGGPTWDPNNLQSLCHGHHNGLKRLLQNYARDTRQFDKIIL